MADRVVETYARRYPDQQRRSLFGLNAKPWDAWSTGEWDRILKVNVVGTWLCCKAIAPLMVKTKQREKLLTLPLDVWKVPDARFFLPYA